MRDSVGERGIKHADIFPGTGEGYRLGRPDNRPTTHVAMSPSPTTAAIILGRRGAPTACQSPSPRSSANEQSAIIQRALFGALALVDAWGATPRDRRSRRCNHQTIATSPTQTAGAAIANSHEGIADVAIRKTRDARAPTKMPRLKPNFGWRIWSLFSALISIAATRARGACCTTERFGQTLEKWLRLVYETRAAVYETFDITASDIVMTPIPPGDLMPEPPDSSARVASSHPIGATIFLASTPSLSSFPPNSSEGAEIVTIS